jgi:hypothetical protein
MKKNLNEQVDRIKSMMGLIMEQNIKRVSIQGKQPVSGTDWDLVHGILGSNRISDDLEQRVGDELKNGNYRVTKVYVSSKKVGNEIITDGAVDLTPTGGNSLPHKIFTTRGSIGDDYESRHDTQVNGLEGRLQAYYKGNVTMFGPYTITVDGTNVKYKQSFFAVEGQASQGQQTNQQNTQQTPISVSNSDMEKFRNDVKLKTSGVTIDENSVNFKFVNNTFNVTASPGQTKIINMTLVYDPSPETLQQRINDKIKPLYPNLIEKDEWKGKLGNYSFAFLVLK